MTGHRDRTIVKAELDRLTADFFRAVSFEEGETPQYEEIYGLFIDAGLLVKNSASTPEISTVSQFIEPRQAPAGWKISAMAWDDERPGLSISEQYEPSASDRG